MKPLTISILLLIVAACTKRPAEGANNPVVVPAQPTPLKSNPVQQELFKAASDGDVSRVVELFKKGADVNATDRPNGWSALHYAANSGSFETVLFLVSCGADPTQTGFGPNQTVSKYGLPQTPSLVAGDSVIKYIDISRHALVARDHDEGAKAHKIFSRYKLVSDFLSEAETFPKETRIEMAKKARAELDSSPQKATP